MQTGSREEVGQWMCDVHNIVNERLGKPHFDCTKLAETWNCGCADELEEPEEPDTLTLNQ